jgi:hypothetical protein
MSGSETISISGTPQRFDIHLRIFETKQRFAGVFFDMNAGIPMFFSVS